MHRKTTTINWECSFSCKSLLIGLTLWRSSLHCKVRHMKRCEPADNKSVYILGFPHVTVKAWLLRQSQFSGQLPQRRKETENSFKAPCEHPNCKWGIIIETNDNRQLPHFPQVGRNQERIVLISEPLCHALLLAASKYSAQ